MHERPKYNQRTKRLEKFDYDYEPEIRRRCTGSSTKVKRIAPTRKKPLARKKATKSEDEVNVEFAQLTHETMLKVIDFIKDIQMCNDITENNNKKIKGCEMIRNSGSKDFIEINETSLVDALTTFKKSTGEEENILNVNKTPKVNISFDEKTHPLKVYDFKSVLVDVCTLYCVANNVSQEDLANYLKEVAISKK